MKVLFIGDVHATTSELDDCECLMHLALRTAVEQVVDYVCFLGDSYHNHNVVRVEVMAFWRRTFARFQAAHRPVLALVGNHDLGGEGVLIHAMMAHEEQVTVIDKPTTKGGVLFMPYRADRSKFLEECNMHPTKTLVCHQTFQGSRYENGMYAPDGVDPEFIPQDYVLSGHIHTPQTFGKVTYIGAPRWRTLSDANVERALWLYRFADDGTVVETQSFDTGTTCRQICYVIDTPEEPFTGTVDPNHDWRIDVKGPSEWVAARKTFYGPGVNIRTFRTDQSTVKVRESEGIEKAFSAFMEKYRPKFGTDPTILTAMAKERLANV